MPNAQFAPPPAPAAPADPGALLAALAQMGQAAQANPPAAPQPALVAAHTMAPAAPPAMPFQQNLAPPPPPQNMFPSQPPAPVAGQAFAQPATNNDIAQQLLAALMAGQIAAEQVPTILQFLQMAQQQPQQQQQPPQAAPFAPPPPQLPVAAPPQPMAQPVAQPQQDRYEQNGSRYRDRSRSPDYRRGGFSPDRKSPLHRRNSPTYGVYDPSARGEPDNHHNRHDRDRGRGRGKNRGRGGRDDYRQRTPPGQRRQPSPPRNFHTNGQGKFLDWDRSLPAGHIRVLSRTLFVGGAGGTEQEIRSIFSRFGKVQTCIVNHDKRHAFVKMINRQDAVNAKEGMDNMTDQAALSKARQVRSVLKASQTLLT